MYQQITSFYGLLSTKEIGTPSPSGQFITVPFFTGCTYAAYPAKDSKDVNIIDYNLCSTNEISNDRLGRSFHSMKGQLDLHTMKNASMSVT